MPHIEWRGGTCRVKWWGGEYRPDGKKRYESKSGFADEDEAYNYGLDREYDVRHGAHVPLSEAKTLMSVYCWRWYGAVDLRPKSMAAYKSMLNAVIVPHWGARAIGEITALEYELWRKQVKAKYSANYSSQLLALFRMLMDDAVVKYKLRKESPIVEQRSRGRYIKKPREKKQPMEMAVVHRLACNAYRVWGYTGWVYIWTIAFTGMRPPGEMYGLQRGYSSVHWPASEPDPDRRRENVRRYAGMHALRVEYQLQKVNGAPTLVGPKYDSHRTLVVPPFLHEMHRALLASHSSPWMFLSLTGGSLLPVEFGRDYWYPTRDGRPAFVPRPGRNGWAMRTGRDGSALLPVEEMAGKRIYLLRHAHKEWLDESGIPKVAAEARMGHELPGVEGVYANVTRLMERRIVETLQERWETFWAAGVHWMPPSPKFLPESSGEGVSPQFSGVPVVDPASSSS